MEFNLFIVHLFRNITLYKANYNTNTFDREALASASLIIIAVKFDIPNYNYYNIYNATRRYTTQLGGTTHVITIPYKLYGLKRKLQQIHLQLVVVCLLRGC